MMTPRLQWPMPLQQLESRSCCHTVYNRCMQQVAGGCVPCDFHCSHSAALQRQGQPDSAFKPCMILNVKQQVCKEDR